MTGQRLTTLAIVVRLLLEILLCFLVGMIVIIAGYAMIKYATTEDPKPPYCYVDDARATAPECGGE